MVKYQYYLVMCSMRSFALITGATGGLGQAIAYELVAKYDLLLLGRNSVQLKKLKQLLKSQGVVEILEIDLSQPPEIEAIFTLDLPWDRWTLLVNNAGVSLGSGITESSLHEWNTMLGVNLTAPYLLTQQFVKNAQLHKLKGSIVNISSMMGQVGSEKDGYSSSKAGLTALTKSVARQVGPTLRCNAIIPGAIETEMIAEWDEAMKQKVTSNTPLGRYAQPSEIAKIVSFLADEEASGYLTGSVINATGGQYLGF